MEILGIGPLELITILVIALIVLGPTDMVKAGRTLGRFMRRIITSPGWRTFQQASRDLRYLPNKLMREAGLDELEHDLQELENKSRATKSSNIDSNMKEWQREISSWTSPPPTIGTPPNEPDSPASAEPDEEQASDQNSKETEPS
jgi:sec-independent protein translocase protein TatB